jgi:UDP-N-acetylglucosamine transferase subunit ALG13
MSFGDVCTNIRAASVVITHAGAGSTLVCVQQGKHPIMVPRQSRHGEHIDDHQLPFALKLGDAGLATVVMDTTDLRAAISDSRDRRAPAQALTGARDLVSWLERYWQALAAERPYSPPTPGGPQT